MAFTFSDYARTLLKGYGLDDAAIAHVEQAERTEQALKRPLRRASLASSLRRAAKELEHARKRSRVTP